MKKDILLVWVEEKSVGGDKTWDNFVESKEAVETEQYFIVELGQTIQIYKII